MRSQLATFPAFGVDTTLRLDASACRHLIASGYSYVVRYLGGIDAKELATIMCSGLAFMPVTYSRAAGWSPSAEMGAADGDKSVGQLVALGLPRCTVWLDLEGCLGPAAETSAWVNAWAQKIAAAGFEPGLYVGAIPGGLDSSGLWKLKVVRYWRGCSIVPEPEHRGFCHIQLRPPEVHVGATKVDIDVLCEDWKGDKPTWVVD